MIPNEIFTFRNFPSLVTESPLNFQEMGASFSVKILVSIYSGMTVINVISDFHVKCPSPGRAMWQGSNSPYTTFLPISRFTCNMIYSPCTHKLAFSICTCIETFSYWLDLVDKYCSQLFNLLKKVIKTSFQTVFSNICPYLRWLTTP